MRKIPVFVSCPTNLNPVQEQKRSIIITILNELQMEPRALGRSDYPVIYPLKEVYVLAKHCSGGLILGFEQVYIKSGIRNRSNANEEKRIKDICIPSPWNDLEAGILFGLQLPLLIFREDKIDGGVFDYGATDACVNSMPSVDPDENSIESLKQIMLTWHGSVSKKYYGN